MLLGYPIACLDEPEAEPLPEETATDCPPKLNHNLVTIRSVATFSSLRAKVIVALDDGVSNIDVALELLNMSTFAGLEVPVSRHGDVEKKVIHKSSSSLGIQPRMNRASAKASRSTSLSEVTSISRFSQSVSDMGDPEKDVTSQDTLASKTLKIEGLTMKRMATPDLEENRPDETVSKAAEDGKYPGSLALALLIIGICLSVFLVSLDRTIVATV